MPVRAPFWESVPPRNQRLDPHLYATAGQAIFVTIRAFGRSAPFADSRLAEIAIAALLEQAEKGRCSVLAYCLMPDHLHLIATPQVDGASLLTAVDRFKGYSSYRLHRAGLEGKVWQPRSYDHIIRRQDDLNAIALYILQNPVRRSLCGNPEDYPHSSLLLDP